MMFFVSSGFMAGAIAGILLAPEKGEVTRDKLKKKATELGEDVANKYESEIEVLKAKIEEMKAQFSNGVMSNFSDEEKKKEEA